MLAGMTSLQLAEWQAYGRLEPFGELRGDARAGIIAAVFHNTMRGKKGKFRKPEDFMPHLKEARERGRQKISVSDQIKEYFARFNKAE